jgi:CubicO group peptidase (beta-lactamase class C family)/cephalosporin-C deacetylase-like acetyl esterase
MKTVTLAAGLGWLLTLLPEMQAAPPAVEKGTVRFEPVGDQKNVPERYRLQAHQFDYRMEQIRALPLSGLDVYHLTFPSPVESPCKENNTVHAEYYRPRVRGKFPCVIVLDITGGDQSLSRTIATHLAQNRIGGLFVQMAYYGPRRPQGSRLRLLSTNIPRTFAAIRQTVLDLRRAAAWMAGRPEIDAAQLGIMGTSLGSFMAALTGEMEPRLGRVAVLLGGGGFVDGYYNHPQAKAARLAWEAVGGSKAKAVQFFAPIDPITCAANLREHDLLILAAKRDDIVPPRMAEALWKASGRQKIVWFNCTHYGAIIYLVPALDHLVKHFGPRARAAEPDRAKLARIRSRMQAFVDDHAIAGAVTVVGTSKGIVSLEAVGRLRLENGEAMPKDALFRIASMTKPITAAGIMILADQGKLSVDDLVEKHLPEFRGQWLVAERGADRLVLRKPARPITLRDLLTHTSGLSAYPRGLGDVYGKRDRTLAEAVLAVSQRPLQFAPGSRWAYCNSGIDTLGRIIEVVSGQDYETFLARRIFEPLGMKDTTFRPGKDQQRRLADLYGRRDGKLVPTPNVLIGPPTHARHPIPAGGLYSTGADLARFYRMMLQGGVLDGKRILSEASVKAMTSVQTGDLACGFTPGMGFGLGFGVIRKPQGVTAMLSPGTYGHGGAFGTQAWIDPKRDLFIVLLIQRSDLPNSDASDMRRELQRLAVAAFKP